MPLALVTGASSGFGREFARRFASAGYDVVAVARRRERLEALAAELSPRQVHVIVEDLSDATAPQRIADELRARGLHVDVLVNNAGFGTHGLFANEDPARIAAEIGVNVVAPTLLTRALLPWLLSAPAGAVINVTSTAAYQACPNQAVYGATKAYLKSLTEALWQECRGTGLRVVNVAPGPADTEFFEVAGSDDFKVGQVVTPEQVVDVAFAALAAGAKTPSHIVGRLNAVQSHAARLAPTRLTLAIADQQLKGEG